MTNSKYQVCFIGNAIVDIISKITNDNLNELKIPKGSMQIINEKSSNKILKYVKNPIIISGGSAANTAVGFSSFGGKCSFIGQTGNDEFGILFSRDLNNSGVFFENKIPESSSPVFPIKAQLPPNDLKPTAVMAARPPDHMT